MKGSLKNEGTAGVFANSVPAFQTKNVKGIFESLFGFDTAAKSQQETEEYSKKFCCTDKVALMKYIILEKCADIRGVYTSDDDCLHLRGRHSMHDVTISTSGASITSAGNDRRTMMEARSIMKFLSAYQGC